MENSQPKALIFGASGQDGFFLSRLLYEKGYQISDSNHVQESGPFQNLLKTDFGSPHAKGQIKHVIETFRPNEIYNFAGVSDIFDPWHDAEKTFKVNGLAPQYILESIVEVDKSIKFFQASSILAYYNQPRQDEDCNWIDDEIKDRRSPLYPYGCAKRFTDHIIQEYRREFGIFACSGIMTAHESSKRSDKFFSKKIINFAKAVKAGSKDILKVGDLTQRRNIGFAPKYCEATFLMLQNKEPKDYIIANNSFDSKGNIINYHMVSNELFIQKCFDYIGKNWENHIEVDESLKRKSLPILYPDASGIYKDLNWKCATNIDDIIEEMMK